MIRVCDHVQILLTFAKVRKYLGL